MGVGQLVTQPQGGVWVGEHLPACGVDDHAVGDDVARVMAVGRDGMAFGEHALVPVIRNGLPLCFPIKDSAVVPAGDHDRILDCGMSDPAAGQHAVGQRRAHVHADGVLVPVSEFFQELLGHRDDDGPVGLSGGGHPHAPHGHRRVARRVEPELAFRSVADLEAQAGLVGVGEQGDLAGRQQFRDSHVGMPILRCDLRDDLPPQVADPAAVLHGRVQVRHVMAAVARGVAFQIVFLAARVGRGEPVLAGMGGPVETGLVTEHRFRLRVRDAGRGVFEIELPALWEHAVGLDREAHDTARRVPVLREPDAFGLAFERFARPLQALPDGRDQHVPLAPGNVVYAVFGLFESVGIGPARRILERGFQADGPFEFGGAVRELVRALAGLVQAVPHTLPVINLGASGAGIPAGPGRGQGRSVVHPGGLGDRFHPPSSRLITLGEHSTLRVLHRRCLSKDSPGLRAKIH